MQSEPQSTIGDAQFAVESVLVVSLESCDDEFVVVSEPLEVEVEEPVDDVPVLVEVL